MKGELIYKLQLYYKDEYIKLFQGDCLEVMDKLIEKGIKFNAIITDPPYGTTQCKWDSVIPLDKMWERLNKLIKNNGAICLFGSEPFSTKVRVSSFDMYKYDWYWKKSKPVGFANAKKMPLKDVETISIFYKSLPKYNPQGLLPMNKIRKGDKNKSDGDFNGQKYYRPSQSKDYIQEFTNYPTTVLNFPSEGKILHPTQKPLDLMKYFIATYSD